MATKKKTGQEKRKGPPFDGGDSPIMVGGGGGIGPWVDLEFDHNVYLPQPGRDRDRHVNPDRVLDYILVDNGTPTNLPAKSKIVIEFQKGGTRNITIEADAPSVPLGVKFNGNHLPYNHQQKKHRDDGSQLKQLIINGGRPIPLLTNAIIEIHTT